MKFLRSMLIVSAALFVGCSANTDDAQTTEASELNASERDATTERELRSAIDGLVEPNKRQTPWQLAMWDLDKPMTDAVIREELLTTLDGVLAAGGPAEPREVRDLENEWVRRATDANPVDYADGRGNVDEVGLNKAKSRDEKWKTIRRIFERDLKDINCFYRGYYNDKTGMLKAGTIGMVFIGQSTTGKVFAVWAVERWG